MTTVALDRRDRSLDKRTEEFVQLRYSKAFGPLTWQELETLSNQHFQIHHARLGCDFTFVSVLLNRSLPRTFGRSGGGEVPRRGGPAEGPGRVGWGSEAAGVSHNSPRAQTCTFEGPGLQKNHQNSTKGPPREGRKKEIVAGEGKKAKFCVVRRRAVQERAVLRRAVFDRKSTRNKKKNRHKHEGEQEETGGQKGFPRDGSEK